MNRMVYTLNIKCMESKFYNNVECVWIIEIAENSSLVDLHLIIQELVGCANEQTYDFYGGRYPCKKDLLIGKDRFGRFIPGAFGRIGLKEVYPLASELKLYYLLNYKDRKIFQITKIPQLKQEIPDICYPREIPKRIESNSEQYYSMRL